MVLKRSQEQFIAEMKEINPHVEILGKYTGIKNKIEVRCLQCKRIWNPLAGNLLKGAGCIDCSGFRNDKKSHEEFEAEIKEVLPSITLKGLYQGTKHKILCKCNICHNEWKANPSTLRKGHGCPVCARKDMPGRTPISHQEFSKRIRLKNPNIRLTSEYKSAHDSITCHCNICGLDWDVTAASLDKYPTCPECRKIEMRNKRAQKFFEQAKQKFPSINISGEYISSGTPMDMYCCNCGHHWKKKPVAFLRSAGCPKCRQDEIARSLRKSHNDYVRELHSANPNIEVVGEYVNSHTKIEFHCKACGNNWIAAPQSLLNGSGCPKCAISGTSYMEQFIFFAMESVLGKGKIVARSKSAIGKELDMYIPEYKVAIEPGGWFWHKDKLDIDKTKRELCRIKGIRLITIYDTVPDDFIDSIKVEDCYLYSYSLAEEAKHEELKNLVKVILAACDPRLVDGVEEIPWESIDDLATKYSKRMSHVEFIERMATVNPNIEITGVFEDRLTKVSAKCKACSHEWAASPQNLLQGHQCPKCANKVRALKQTKTHEYFVEELKRKCPNTEVLERYTHGNTEILFRCIDCKHEWKARPNKVLLSKGCPECSKRNRGKKRRFSPEDFKKRSKVQQS